MANASRSGGDDGVAGQGPEDAPRVPQQLFAGEIAAPERTGENQVARDQQGAALASVVRVTNTTATSARPDVSCDASGNSHIVWQEGDNVNAAGQVITYTYTVLGVPEMRTTERLQRA